MPLRVLVLSSTYPRWLGDPEPGFVHELSRRLATRFDVAVLAPHAQGACRLELMDGVMVHRYRYAPEALETLVAAGGIVGNLKRQPWKWLLMPLFLIAQSFAIWRMLRHWQPDVVHAHWLIPQGLLIALLSRLGLAKKPFIVTSHGADLFALKRFPFPRLKRFVIERAALVTVVSGVMRAEVSRLASKRIQVAVSPMGVDMRNRFTPEPLVPRARNRLLFVGRLVEKKGLRHLLDIVPALSARHPDLQLDIVGGGPEEAALRLQVDNLGLRERVHFLGPKPQAELPALYRAATLFVAPFVEADSGDQEGLGLVTVEAVACGCPVLIGSVPAARDVPVTSIDVRNQALFAAEVAKILDDPVRAAELAIRQREACLHRFDWEKVAQDYEELIKECGLRA